MNIIIACDSFKGSLSSLEVANNIKTGALKIFPSATFKIIAMADGGEGTVDAMLSSIEGTKRTITVKDPLMQDVEASYGIFHDGSAIIEMAAASGLTLVNERKDVYKANTYGTGQLIEDAMDKGCKTIYIGIGGSATNDGGIGMASALGVRFLDKNQNILPPDAYSLMNIDSIDVSHLDSRIKDTEIIVMCDVDNPLCGKQGASAIYGPQKGATPKQIDYLDKGLKHLARVVKDSGLIDASNILGSGAAGGLGFGLVAFLNATLSPGVDVILKANHFDEMVGYADIVITGEGRIDYQSIHGKVPVGVAKVAKQKNKPTVAIVGCIGSNAELVYEHGISTIESCIYAPCTLKDALNNASGNIQNATQRVLRSIKIGTTLKL